MRRASFLHLAVLAAFGAGVVATPWPLDLAALVGWALVVRRWARGVSGAGWRRIVLIQGIGMAALVTAAAMAPVKIEDQVKARTVTLPRREMTLDELTDPAGHGLERFFYGAVSVPDGLGDRAVRFPSRELTIGRFIDAVESQTRLRHRFHHCGNGSTILWGGDCSFGLRFRLP